MAAKSDFFLVSKSKQTKTILVTTIKLFDILQIPVAVLLNRPNSYLCCQSAALHGLVEAYETIQSHRDMQLKKSGVS